MKNKLGQLLAAATVLIRSLGDDVDGRMSAFHRSVLFIVFAVAAGRSLYGFLQSQSPGSTTHIEGAGWVYLSLAVVTALSLLAHQRLPAFRTCAFAFPTIALGISFVLLDFRTRLGWTIVVGTAVASMPLIAHDLLRARARRGLDVRQNGQVDDRR
ncbi:MAG: hypothetical protein OXG44_06445 [Gammaproteobacteria bacterium]|nr:hypothetical protein [Gammaproteobacteria bacterium]